MLYILYFSMFQCSLTGGGVRCFHSSQECYIYYTSACSNAPSLGAVYGGVRCVHSSQECYIYYASACSNALSLGAVYGVFIAHKNVIYIMLQHVPVLSHWGQCTVVGYRTPVSLRHRQLTTFFCPNMVG